VATVLLLWLNTVGIFAQRNVNQDPVYGFDPLLYNGATYSFFVKPGTSGSQYLFKEFDLHGSVTLRGVTFNELVINYDIFNQQLVLRYTNASGATSLMAISAAWLQKFEINGCRFGTFVKTDTLRNIYQFLGDGPDKILYSFRKELLLDNFKTTGNRYFSESRKEMFVLTGGEIAGFGSNRGFVKCFGPGKREDIKKYLRKNKVKVKKASDLQMNGLINYCGTPN
jgi:hypothetical protein